MLGCQCKASLRYASFISLTSHLSNGNILPLWCRELGGLTLYCGAQRLMEPARQRSPGGGAYTEVTECPCRVRAHARAYSYCLTQSSTTYTETGQGEGKSSIFSQGPLGSPSVCWGRRTDGLGQRQAASTLSMEQVIPVLPFKN